MSRDQRGKAAKLLATGLSQSEVARKLGVSRQLISYWLKSEKFQEAIKKSKADLAKKQASATAKVEDFVSTTISEPPPSAHVPHPPIAKQVSRISTTEALRQEELIFLEKIQESLMPQLEERCFRSAALMLKISERRCKLLGLDKKNLDLIEAFQVLTDEGILPSVQIKNASDSLIQFREQLKSSLSPS